MQSSIRNGQMTIPLKRPLFGPTVVSKKFKIHIYFRNTDVHAPAQVYFSIVTPHFDATVETVVI